MDFSRVDMKMKAMPRQFHVCEVNRCLSFIRCAVNQRVVRTPQVLISEQESDACSGLGRNLDERF